ncbi:hypothetical protein AB0N62_42230 [Streptomyces sp. NPDC093982]
MVLIRGATSSSLRGMLGWFSSCLAPTGRTARGRVHVVQDGDAHSKRYS